MASLWNSIITSLSRFNIVDAVDILLVTVLIYYVLKLVRQTRAVQVLRGVAFVLAIAWISSIIGLQTVSWIFGYIITSGTIALVVLFQPELRRMLEQLGRGRILDSIGRLRTGRDSVQEITRALLDLSKQHVGALIALQRQVGLEDIVETGTRVEGIVSAALLETIFKTGTALHDGAAIIHDEMLLAAGCFLPLTQRQGLDQTVGTRHRAAIGLSEVSDAIVFVVSEENGVISAAVEGRLLRNLTAASIRALMTTGSGEGQPAPSTVQTLLDRLRNRKRKQP